MCMRECVLVCVCVCVCVCACVCVCLCLRTNVRRSICLCSGDRETDGAGWREGSKEGGGGEKRDTSPH